MLTVTNLTGGYGDIRVLWDVELTVRPGKLTAVLGRNGAGKTSLLDAVSGLLPAVSSGALRLDGDDITRASTPARVRHGLGYVQQNKQIFKRRTVEENLLIGGYVLPGRGLRGPARRAALEQAYDRFSMLAERRQQPAGGLSGGQQQMLGIAQALMPGPKLLMLDEPSAGLAPSIVAEVFGLIAQLRDDGLSILLVEQVVDDALEIADDVVVLESGHVAAAGPAERFSDNDIVREIYLGNDVFETDDAAQREVR
ncbi:ABC transporter ATP-binding protein [Kribbella solani]|uniref:ABC transporter ATP-binding protein n=1 Tax=Kribbella solani TaxID=236067 RepID=UPI0029B44E1F|nr:ABC transporter ATP-binding protein [Kribbella solani]MDX2972660.1 ABC transporter ATP-binding protein [Kribbella solani]MDX3001655.1 ABC transporter ATP-binding protein [Kribbella solani]